MNMSVLVWRILLSKYTILVGRVKHIMRNAGRLLRQLSALSVRHIWVVLFLWAEKLSRGSDSLAGSMTRTVLRSIITGGMMLARKQRLIIANAAIFIHLKQAARMARAILGRPRWLFKNVMELTLRNEQEGSFIQERLCVAHSGLEQPMCVEKI